VNAAGDHRVRVGDPLDITKEIDRRAADRRQQDLNIGPGDQLREHAPGLLEKRTPQIGLADAKAGGQPRQMPYRVDCRFGDTDFAIVEQHRAVGPQCAVGEKRAKFWHGEPRPRDGDGRTRVDTGADMFGENLADEVAPGIERHDLRRIGPLRMGADQRGGRGVGEIGAVITRQGSRRDREGAIDRVSAGVGTDRVPVARLSGARYHRSPVGRAGRSPTQRDCALTGGSGVGSQSDVARYRMLHVPSRWKSR